MESRLWAALALYTYGVLGVFLLFVPWTGMWASSAEALLPEGLAGFAVSGWVRGVASSLGALDLLVAFKVALQLWGEPGQKKRRR